MRKIQIAGYGIESAELPEDSEVLMQEGSNLEEATEALEAFALLLQPAVEGYAVNPAALAAVSTVTNRLVRKAGLPVLSVGTESVVVDTVQQAASLGLEDIKEHLKNAVKAVIEFLKKIGRWISEKFSAMLDVSVKKITAAKDAIKTAASDAYNRKKLIDVSHFYVNGKLNGTELSKTLEWATSDAGFVAFTGTFEEGFDLGMEVGEYAYSKVHADGFKASSPESIEFVNNIAKKLFGVATKGLKFDSEGWVTNWPGKTRIGVTIDAGAAEGKLAIERLVQVSESKKVETTLEKVGITVSTAEGLTKNLDKFAGVVKAAAETAKNGNKEIEKLIKGMEEDQEVANFMRRYFQSLFVIVQFQGDCARNVVNTLGEITRVIKAGNAE